MDLLDKFPEYFKAFSGCSERFHETAVTENRKGKERKMNSRHGYSQPEEKWGERAEIKASAKRKSCKNI